MVAYVEKRGDRFVKTDDDYLYTFELVYDADGNYVGQYQEDVTEGGLLFFNPSYDSDGKPCVNDVPVEPLTAEQMQNARV